MTSGKGGLGRQAIIIHGWGADSQSNWFPWLAKELGDRGWRVLVPDFPNTQDPVLEDWLEHLDRFLEAEALLEQTPKLVMIGHSLGVPFILRFLEHLPSGRKIKAAHLVSGFHRRLGIREIENFVNSPFDWKKIRRSCGKFFVINADNDPYIPLEIGRDLARKLGVDLIIEVGGDHLSAPAQTRDGRLAYPRLLELICA